MISFSVVDKFPFGQLFLLICSAEIINKHHSRLLDLAHTTEHIAMGIGQKGYYDLVDVSDAEKSTRKKMRRKRKSCLWLCCSSMELGSFVQEEGQEEKPERSAVKGLPVVSAFSHVDEKEKGVLVLANKSRLLMCCSNLEVNTKDKPVDNV